MLKFLRESRLVKMIMIVLTFQIVFGNAFITTLNANGPSQPEMQGASAMNVENWVDPFTGDFSYSIPLMDIGNIPLSLNYQAGITMEQESSWVGLGWSLNPGSITRSVRGLPDDFNKDEVTNILHLKPNKTYSVGIKASILELLGKDITDIDTDTNGVISNTELGDNPFSIIKPEIKFIYNNYDGFSVQSAINQSFDFAKFGQFGYFVQGPSQDNFGDVGVTFSPSLGRVLEQSRNVDGENSGPFNKVNATLVLSQKKGLERISLDYNYNKYGKGGGIGFAQNFDKSYSPKSEHSFRNNSYSGSFSFGVDWFATDVLLGFVGGYSEQKIENEDEEKVSKAIGYLYCDNDGEESDILMDFNREKDGQIYEGTPNLPLAYLTYDIFSISSPGIGGSFRAYRNDIGYIQEPHSSIKSNSITGGYEGSFGNLTSPGVDFGYVNMQSESNNWEESNANITKKYSSDIDYDKNTERVHFAMLGEAGYVNETEYMDQWGGKQPAEMKVTNEIFSANTFNSVSINEGASYNVNGVDEQSRSERIVQNVDITYVTHGEVNKRGLNLKYEINENAKSHHIEQIIVTSSDGTRYIYGLPVYNITQSEVSFSVGKEKESDDLLDYPTDNLIDYTSDQNTTGNSSGKDNYYSENIIPAYAHTYLLTEILSPDYVDATGDGASRDDLGGYVIYNYGEYNAITQRNEADIKKFKWRTPFTNDSFKANYYEGMRQDPTDDKASYVYGEKEIWYLESVETKEYIAKMFTSERHDGYQVSDKNGGLNEASEQLLKLDSIRIFSWSGYLYPGQKPEKTIHFEYDYQLCKGYPGNSEIGEGKLTLKKVYFTYGDSKKAKYNGYSFEYLDNAAKGDPDYNFPYHFMYTDRWGNYKVPGFINNIEFPYVDQSLESKVDKYAGAWNLFKIHTPGGGAIEIEYESDDYGYVHNLPATEMTEIYRVSTTDADDPTYSDNWYNLLFLDDGNPLTNEEDKYIYLIFKLKHPIDGSKDQTYADNEVRNNYILFDDHDPGNGYGIVKNLYFKVSLNTNSESGDSKNEYVSGYAELDLEHYAGAIKRNTITGLDDDYNYGYVKLKTEKVKRNGFEIEVNPISKAGWQYTMLHARNNIISESSISNNEDADQVISAILNSVSLGTLLDLFQNPNETMLANDYCNSIEHVEAGDRNKAWIRLKNPDSKKKGGGHRVKSVTVYDNWDQMTAGEDASFYTKEYSYTLEDGKSAGVAAYEPAIGGDENPNKIPVYFGFEPDREYKYRFYTEKPFGEEFFPAPIVGYSRVEVKSKSVAKVKRTATGRTVFEFYTTRDYPFDVEYSGLDPIILKPDMEGIQVFPTPYYHMYTASQGYAIVVNDMHGKLKSVSDYAEGAVEPYTSSLYKYFDDGFLNITNTVKGIDVNNNIADYELGVTIDHTLDYRASNSRTIGGSTQFNLDVFSAGVIPLPFITIPGELSSNFERLNTVVSTKVIYRKGILKETIVQQDGSTVTARNELWDIKTGNVVMTSTQNEFEDRYYTFTYPAHWMYPGMGVASENSDYYFDSNLEDDQFNWDDGEITSANLKNMLIPGDEIFFTVKYDVDEDGDTDPGYEKYFKGWVYNKLVGATDKLYFMDKDGVFGSFGTLDYTIKEITGRVIRSGSRNLQGVSAGGFVCREIPYDDADNPTQLQVNASKKIIASSMSEYSDKWNMNCQAVSTPNNTQICYCNPDVTIPGRDFANFLEDVLSHGENAFESTTNIAIHQIDGADELFQYGFTPVLDDILSDVSDYVSLLNVATVTTSNVQYIFKSNLGDNICTFNLEFTDVGVDLTDGTTEDIFYNPNPDPEFAEDDVFVRPLITVIIPDESTGVICDDVTDFNIEITYFDNDLEEDVTLHATCSDFTCFPLRDCFEIDQGIPYCYGRIGEAANPYVKGLLGVWNKKIDYTYLVDRNVVSYTDISSVNLKEDGYFNDFNKFWVYGAKWKKNADISGWQWTAQAEKHNLSIGLVESSNPLEILSSFSYGLNNTAAEMVCDNASYKTIGFENFEDNDFNKSMLVKECESEHFNIHPDVEDGSITTRWAHTGNYSMRILAAKNVMYEIDLEPEPGSRDEYTQSFYISADDCLPAFSPEENATADKKFLLTYWVRETDELNDLVDAEGSKLETAITLDDPTLGLINLIDVGSFKSTDLIEGWRKQEMTFTVPAESEGVFKITFENTASDSYPIYIDDIRINPFDAIASCFVFNNRTQRLMAEMDANHYSTFYEYDEDGKLVRVKKETDRGIVTIQEGRYSFVKQ